MTKLSCCFFLCIAAVSYSQPVSVTTGLSAELLVQTVFLGNTGITVSNVTSVNGNDFGSVNSLGYFENLNPDFDLSSGIVLTSGSLFNVPGPNLSTQSEGTYDWPGDVDLTTVINDFGGFNQNSHNATVLEFDFTSDQSPIQLSFVYASEEYGSFICNQIDGIAILLTDLNSGNTINLGVVPGTDLPVSNSTIRNYTNSPCPNMNEQYFDAFFFGANAATAPTNFNWQSHRITAVSEINAAHQYHIKFVVGDTQDTAIDTALFLEAGSFGILGTAVFSADTFRIGPNPADDHVEIFADAFTEVANVSIYDLSGRKVTVHDRAMLPITIGTSGLTAGIYIVEAQTADSEKLTRKLIVRH